MAQAVTTQRPTSYVFHVSLEEEDDGRWSAWIEALPGCNAWGDSRESALQGIQDAAELYVGDMAREGEAIPTERVPAIGAPVVTVTTGE